MCASAHRTAPAVATTAGTHPANVAAGLVPLEDPQVRAGVCLDCHYGSAEGNQFVTHRMMAAGHPRIVFERLFGEGGSVAERRAALRKRASLLDWVTEDMASLKRRLGQTE
mgnify:CR=1 FL=1